MAIKTYTEQLEEVQDAISAIVNNGQSYRIGDRMMTRADLGMLQERETYLRRMAARESTGGGLRIRRGVSGV